MVIDLVEPNELYECPACGTIVEIIDGSDTVPVCCEQDMVLIAKKDVEGTDKNICGFVMQCEGCRIKVRVLKDGGGTLFCCLKQMGIGMKEDIESGNIYVCKSCGQIVKITKGGCGSLHCCDDEVCEVDLSEIKELKKRVAIAIASSKDRPYEQKYHFCETCGREVRVIQKGEGILICHTTPMEQTIRIGYYFQGGG